MRTGWLARGGLRAEQRPEFRDANGGARTYASGALTFGEAALMTWVRIGALRFAARREAGRLPRLRSRLVRSALRAGPAPASRPAVRDARPGGGRQPGPAADLTIGAAIVWSVVGIVVVVEFLFWLTLARQSVRLDDYTSPAALQAVALALLFPAVVFGGARIGAALGHLLALPPGEARTWYRVRAAFGVGVVVAMSIAMAVTARFRFSAEGALVGASPLPVAPLTLAFFVVPILTLAVHAFAMHPTEATRRAEVRDDVAADRLDRRRTEAAATAQETWHLATVALEAEIVRVRLRYDLLVARGEAGLLRERARTGAAPAPLVDPSGGDERALAPHSWLGMRLLPIEHALVTSERVLADYRSPVTGPDPLGGGVR